MRASTFSSKLALAAVLSSSLACAGKSSSPWAEPSADPKVVNLTPASFADGSGVTDLILTECDLEHAIAEKIARHATVPVALTEADSGARTLSLEVITVIVPGGREAAGPKSVTVVGELYEDDDLSASFEAKRTTSHDGATCDMLEFVVDELGKDVASWLAAPSLDAKLGET